MQMVYEFDLETKERARWFNSFLEVLQGITYKQIGNTFTIDCTALNDTQIEVLERAFRFMEVLK